MMAWSREAVASAKKEALYLIKLQIKGNHATTGPLVGGNVSMSATANAQIAHLLMWASHLRIVDGAKPLPPATIRALREALSWAIRQTMSRDDRIELSRMIVE